MAETINIKMEWVFDPPEKVLFMFEAVSRLLRSGRRAGELKVSEITKDAGIGKGTAYEYFSSKEELIASALMYEYSIKIRELADAVFACSSFQGRIFCVMDWIRQNREYNEMFRELVKETMQNCPSSGCEEMELPLEAKNYLVQMIEILMKEGIREGVISETHLTKQVQVLFSAMFEYAVAINFSAHSGYGQMEEEELRAFIYEGISKRLN